MARNNRYLFLLTAILAMLSLPGVANAAIKGKVSADSKDPVKSLSVNTSNFSAGSTSDGPATEADCDRYANQMNALIDLSIKLVLDGEKEPGEVDFILESVDSLRDTAEDQGCFVVD